MNALPGAEYRPDDLARFGLQDDFVDYLRNYAETLSLPVVEGATVEAVEQKPEGGFRVRSSEGEYSTSSVIVTSGAMSRPAVPAMADGLNANIAQFNAVTYRNPASLPDGATLVVGAAQSGVQIVEDLLEAGREVYLCISRVWRTACRDRGQDGMAWLRAMGALDMKSVDVEIPDYSRPPSPRPPARMGATP
jgi:putative flavoprotein involved in K+ transport